MDADVDEDDLVLLGGIVGALAFLLVLSGAVLVALMHRKKTNMRRATSVAAQRSQCVGTFCAFGVGVIHVLGSTRDALVHVLAVHSSGIAASKKCGVPRCDDDG